VPISGPARNRLQVEDRKAREHLQSDDGWPLTQSTGQGRGPVIAYGPAKGWSVQLAWRIVGPYVPYNAKVRQTNSHCRMGVSGGRELMPAVALLKGSAACLTTPRFRSAGRRHPTGPARSSRWRAISRLCPRCCARDRRTRRSREGDLGGFVPGLAHQLTRPARSAWQGYHSELKRASSATGLTNRATALLDSLSSVIRPAW
jgi:hypothetical protein